MRVQIVLLGQFRVSVGDTVIPADAWRREPYYRQLREWAARSVRFRGQVIAAVGRRMYMIFPDRDVDLGIVGLEEFIVVDEMPTPLGVRLEARKVAKDDPRAQSVAQQ